MLHWDKGRVGIPCLEKDQEDCPPRGLSPWRNVCRRLFCLEDCPLEDCPPGGLSPWRTVPLEDCSPGGMSAGALSPNPSGLTVVQADRCPSWQLFDLTDNIWQLSATYIMRVRTSYCKRLQKPLAVQKILTKIMQGWRNIHLTWAMLLFCWHATN